MNINRPISFKGYVPVKYMAKDEESGQYFQITDKDNVKKCQGFVVRNLNGTAKNNRNTDFVDLYRQYDRDYRRVPKVQSVYDKNSPIVHMVTGSDVEVVKNYAKPIGIAKGEALDRIGRSDSFEARSASRSYFRNVTQYIKNKCKRLKSFDGNNLSLVVYFDPKYTRTNKLKGFEYVGAKFEEEV